MCSVRGGPSGSSEVLGSRLDCRRTANRVLGSFLSCPHGLSRPRAGGCSGQRWLCKQVALLLWSRSHPLGSGRPAERTWAQAGGQWPQGSGLGESPAGPKPCQA